MKGISINNYKLHQIRMLTVPYSKGVVSYLSYPKHRIQFEFKGNSLFVKLPSFVALELYRRGILPQNAEEAISVKVSGKVIGKFQIIDFRYPNSSSYEHDMIAITLEKMAKNHDLQI